MFVTAAPNVTFVTFAWESGKTSRIVRVNVQFHSTSRMAGQSENANDPMFVTATGIVTDIRL